MFQQESDAAIGTKFAPLMPASTWMKLNKGFYKSKAKNRLVG